MQFGWRIAVMLLLLLLLLPAVTEAQSGDGDSDMEPRISCFSHIMLEKCNLTCKLLEGRNDNVDDEDDGGDGGDSIERMTLCYYDYSGKRRKQCMETSGDTFSSKALKPVMELNLTVHLKGGGRISQKIDLKKIVKPMSPQVFNITFNKQANQAKIWIRTPYHKDFLGVNNQLFQFQIRTAEKTTSPVGFIVKFCGSAGSERVCFAQLNQQECLKISCNQIQNISSQDFIHIDMKHLEKCSKCYVKVRSIPEKLKGTWSDWSETFAFLSPAEKDQMKTSKEQMEVYQVILCLVSVLLVTSCMIALWKNKIFTYMWPNIPHPKQTLVQICKPNKPLLLTFRPEVFSALKVDPVETAACEEAEPSIGPGAADSAQSSEPCSTQSSDCRSTTSASTEELEISALLSRSSSEAEDSLPSNSPSPVDILQLDERPEQPELHIEGNELEVFGVNHQEDAYVTMSSFYKIK